MAEKFTKGYILLNLTKNMVLLKMRCACVSDSLCGLQCGTWHTV